MFGLAFALGLGDLILSLVPKPSAPVKYSLIAAAGLVLVIGGSGVWLRRRALASSEATESLRRSHGSAAVIGAGIAGLELLTAMRTLPVSTPTIVFAGPRGVSRRRELEEAGARLVTQRASQVFQEAVRYVTGEKQRP